MLPFWTFSSASSGRPETDAMPSTDVQIAQNSDDDSQTRAGVSIPLFVEKLSC